MTKKDFTKWAKLTPAQQASRFKNARIALGLTNVALGLDLITYGYKGGRDTIYKWESGLTKIPPLVYELIFEGFAARTGKRK